MEAMTIDLIARLFPMPAHEKIGSNIEIERTRQSEISAIFRGSHIAYRRNLEKRLGDCSAAAPAGSAACLELREKSAITALVYQHAQLTSRHGRDIGWSGAQVSTLLEDFVLGRNAVFRRGVEHLFPVYCSAGNSRLKLLSIFRNHSLWDIRVYDLYRSDEEYDPLTRLYLRSGLKISAEL